MLEQMLITYSILPIAWAMSYFTLVSSSYNILKPGIFKGDVGKGGSKVLCQSGMQIIVPRKLHMDQI